jgi:hypothetical protein
MKIDTHSNFGTILPSMERQRWRRDDLESQGYLGIREKASEEDGRGDARCHSSGTYSPCLFSLAMLACCVRGLSGLDVSEGSSSVGFD